jgi:hypothetical protein
MSRRTNDGEHMRHPEVRMHHSGQDLDAESLIYLSTQTIDLETG